MQVEVAHSLLTRVDWIWKRVLEMQRGGCDLLRRMHSRLVNFDIQSSWL